MPSSIRAQVTPGYMKPDRLILGYSKMAGRAIRPPKTAALRPAFQTPRTDQLRPADKKPNRGQAYFITILT